MWLNVITQQQVAELGFGADSVSQGIIYSLQNLRELVVSKCFRIDVRWGETEKTRKRGIKDRG